MIIWGWFKRRGRSRRHAFTYRMLLNCQPQQRYSRARQQNPLVKNYKGAALLMRRPAFILVSAPPTNRVTRGDVSVWHSTSMFHCLGTVWVEMGFAWLQSDTRSTLGCCSKRQGMKRGAYCAQLLVAVERVTYSPWGYRFTRDLGLHGSTAGTESLHCGV